MSYIILLQVRFVSVPLVNSINTELVGMKSPEVFTGLSLQEKRNNDKIKNIKVFILFIFH